VLCVETAECIIEILPLSDRPIILVFRHQGSLRKSDGFTPNGGAKYKGVAILVHGLFVPWTIRTLDYSYHRWTIRTLDCSYRGLFVPSWTVRTMDCSYRPWTFRTLDCSYRGLFVPSWTVRTMDYSYRPLTFRTLDCSYHGLFVPSLDDSYHVEKGNIV